MQVQATLTEMRADGMQKWERSDLEKSNHMRYIWLPAAMSKAGVKIGSIETLEFSKGTGGMIGGHWAAWKVIK